MFPSVYTGVYNSPSNFRPPTGAAIFNNTEFPHLNSAEYRSLPVERTIKMHPIWERLALNERGHILIGTNKGHGREWTSTLWCFDKPNAIDQKRALFRMQSISHITNIASLKDNLLLATFRNGGIQLWSTYSVVRDKENPYNLYLVGKRFEHDRPIECLELMGNEKSVHNAITGGQDYTLKIWDFGQADLQSTHTFRFAHVDTIKSIADMKSDFSIFATASRDKSVLLWDCRNVMPAHALYEDHTVGFQEIIWNPPSEKESYAYLYVGDESGFVHVIDKRVTGKFLTSNKFFDRPIRKLAINGDHVAMIADTNVVKIYSKSLGKVVYESSEHNHFVRDCLWYTPDTLLTVGCDSKLCFHKIVL